LTLSNFTTLGPFVSAHSVTAGTVVRDPVSGKELLAVGGSSRTQGAYIELIQPDTGAGTIYPAPLRSPGFIASGLIAVPSRNLLILSTTSDGSFHVFDLVAKKYLNTSALAADTVQRSTWSLALGADGRAYLGAGPPLALLALDFSQAASGKFSVENIPLPTEMATTFSGNEYVHNLIPLPDGRLLCRFMQVGAANYIYDPTTKTFTTAGLPAELESPFYVKPAPIAITSGSGTTEVLLTVTSPALAIEAHQPSGALVASYPVPGAPSGAVFSSNLAAAGQTIYGAIQGTSAAIVSLDLSMGSAKLLVPTPPVLPAGSTLGPIRRVHVNADGTLTVSYLINGSSYGSYLFVPATSVLTPIATGGPLLPESISSGASFGGLLFAGSRAFKLNADKSLALASVSDLPFALPAGATLSSNGGTNYAGQLFVGLFEKSTGSVHNFVVSAVGATPMEVPVAPAHTGQWFGFGATSTQYGVFGEDLYALSATAFTATASQILKAIVDVPLYSASGFLRADTARNRLWGEADLLTQAVSSFDLGTRHATTTQPLTETAGELYGVAFLSVPSSSAPSDIVFGASYLYAASYVGGQIIQYNPDAAWDTTYASNPRVLANLGSYVRDPITKAYVQVRSYNRAAPLNPYVRPMAGIAVSPDRTKLYSGWGATYGRTGGAVAITDPVGGPTRQNTLLVENPFGDAYPYAIIGLDASASYIFVGTSPYVNGMAAFTTPMKFGVIDVQKVNAGATTYLAYAKDFAANDAVEKLVYDANSKRVLVLHHLGGVDVFDAGALAAGNTSDAALWPLAAVTAGLPKVALTEAGGLMSSAVSCGAGFVCYVSRNVGNQPVVVALNMGTGTFTETVGLGAAGSFINSLELDNGKLYGMLGVNLFSLNAQ
jgi:hypothetical protein